MAREAHQVTGHHPGTGLLYTQEFCLLLSRAQRAPIIRRELTDEFVPAGYTPDEVWDALVMIRRSQATVSPDALRLGRSSASATTAWHTVPDSLQCSLRQISALTRRGSRLDAIVDERAGRRFVTQQYVEEVLTNLRLDGFPAGYEEVRGALVGDDVPVNDAQRLARNFHRIMCEMGDYEQTPYDVELLRSLFERLTEGVRRFPAPSEQHSPLEPLYLLAFSGSGEVDASALAAVADIANDRACDPTEDPILVSMLVNCQFWHDTIFPGCNNLMGCIASRLYLYRHGYPVFRYVPKIQLLWSWSHGLARSPRGYALSEAYQPDGHLGLDWTPYYDTVMALMLASVREMERTLCARKAADDAIVADAVASPAVNARQAEVLRRAVIDPGSEFRISWHREEFGVVYSTARADLEGLASMGLLTRENSGGAHVFRPVPGIAARMGRLRLEAGGTGDATGRGDRR